MIQDTLNNTKNYLRSTRKAILGRGGEIANNAGLQDIADAVYKIPADTSLVYQTDDSVTYEKIVPINTEEYAQISKVGGMTYKIQPGYTILYTEYTDEDGSITMYGGDSRRLTFTDLDNTQSNYFTLKDECAGISYICVTLVFVKEGADGSYDVNEVSYPLNSWIPSYNESDYFAVDKKIDVEITSDVYEVTFTPILADTDDLVPKLLDTAVTELVSEGANLMPFPFYQGSSTQLGITVTVNDDASITANGTPTSFYAFQFSRKSMPAGTYTLSCDNSQFVSGVALSISRYSNRTWVSNINATVSHRNASATFEWTEEESTQYALGIQFAVNSGITVNNLTIKPMLNRGTTAAPYKPYRAEAVDSRFISEEIRLLDGYGQGVNSEYYNYIDFERKVFVQNTYRKLFDGTEDWRASQAVPQGSADTGIKRMRWMDIPYNSVDLGVRTISPMICNLYNTDTPERTYYCINKTCSCNGSLFYLYDEAYNTADSATAWKAHLAELYASGNPLIIEYALAEPIETDISEYLFNDNFLAVEGGGIIRAVNEYEQDAPSTINYITKAGT